jgi:uncharacterized membrane protein
VLAIHLFYQGELGHPVNYRDQGALVVLADHSINLPIANAGFFSNDGGTFVNTDTVSNLASFILGSILFFSLLVAVPKMLIQPSTMTLVCPDMLIDELMAYWT